jgi:two-component system sensor kinase
VLENFNDETAGRQVSITVEELPETLGDRELMVQVWTNLISNALKYTKNKEIAIINIGGKIEGKKAVFQISDNGAGFDMQFSDKLFGVFQRLHKTSEFEGIGIGLANVSRIVTRHGGTCRAEGIVDKGAAFFFSIPISD